MYLHDNERLFGRLIEETAKQFNSKEAYILKDYFAVMFLKEAIEANPDLVFKGGTCLSKCYKVINRFSEDVDLGMSCEHATEGMRKRMKAAVMQAADKLGLRIANLDKTRSRREFNRFEIALPSPSMHADDVLLVETAVMTPSAPAQPMPIQSFIGEYCEATGHMDVLKEYALDAFSVMASSLERTFCDKVFAACDYYLAEDIPERQSRHIYDLYKLAGVLEFDSALAELIKLVRSQRQGLHRCPSAEPDVDVVEVLMELIEKAPYQDDYTSRTYPLLYEDVPYQTAVEALSIIASFMQSNL